MDLASNAEGRRSGRLLVVGAAAFWFASACGETQSEGVSDAASGGTMSTEATVATDGTSGNGTTGGGSGSGGSVATSVGGTSGVSSVSVGSTASGGSVTSESSGGSGGTGGTGGIGGSGGTGGGSAMSSSSSAGSGGQVSAGGAISSVASAALSLTAAATTSLNPVCSNGGGDTPLCLTDEEMEYQARYGHGLEPLDPPRSDEEIAAAWDEQGCLPGNWVGSTCCNPGIRSLGRLGNQCCYITCEGEFCCGSLPTGTNTSTTGGF